MASTIFNPDTASSRPQASVQSITAAATAISTLALPAVFVAPIRPDVVRIVHTSMNKNKRQPYAVSPGAGHQHSAESWGTGRAVARIPRVSGGGTGRAGQGAFGNMCRKGRMFAPTKTWRKWHRKLNVNEKRYAVASALAASALPALVEARGHRIAATAEIPLVAEDAIESLTRTKEAVAALNVLGAYADVQRAIDSRRIRAGRGKLRNRRYTQRTGPLIVYNTDNGITKAFRNLPGVELAHVDSLNLLQLAPGGHLGRFIIWSQSSFAKLVDNWGTQKTLSVNKKGYHLPRAIMTNSDLTRVIDSEEIQSKLRAVKRTVQTQRIHGNPLRNFALRVKLNPYAAEVRASEKLALARRAALKASNIIAVAAGKKRVATPEAQAKAALRKTLKGKKQLNYQRLVNDTLYDGFVETKNVTEAAAAAAAAAEKED